MQQFRHTPSDTPLAQNVPISNLNDSNNKRKEMSLCYWASYDRSTQSFTKTAFQPWDMDWSITSNRCVLDGKKWFPSIAEAPANKISDNGSLSSPRWSLWLGPSRSNLGSNTKGVLKQQVIAHPRAPDCQTKKTLLRQRSCKPFPSGRPCWPVNLKINESCEN